MGLTTDPDKARAAQAAEGNEGMHSVYLVLSDDERAKGFVRPVYRAYKHVGILGPRFELRDLTAEQLERVGEYGYVKFEEYPEDVPGLGRYWKQEQLDKIGKGCGTVTTMGLALCETYARKPSFYGATFCCGCNTHLPVGAHGEFVWVAADGMITDLRVGT